MNASATTSTTETVSQPEIVRAWMLAGVGAVLLGWFTPWFLLTLAIPHADWMWSLFFAGVVLTAFARFRFRHALDWDTVQDVPASLTLITIGVLLVMLSFFAGMLFTPRSLGPLLAEASGAAWFMALFFPGCLIARSGIVRPRWLFIRNHRGAIAPRPATPMGRGERAIRYSAIVLAVLWAVVGANTDSEWVRNFLGGIALYCAIWGTWLSNRRGRTV